MALRTFTRGLLRPNRTLKTSLTHIDCAVCLDVESTCDSPVQIEPMEVIELACLKLDLGKTPLAQASIRNLSDRPQFQSFVRPVVNPKLTEFCQDLTGILQSTVDKAQPMDKVLDRFFEWMMQESLVNSEYERKSNFAFASCGNFDLKVLRPMVKLYMLRKGKQVPEYFSEWINVKKVYVDGKKEWPKNLYNMVESLDMDPIGRLHSAQDDSLNLARVVDSLHDSGCKLFITNRINL